MADDDTHRRQGFGTRLVHMGRAPLREHGFVNPPLIRGSTVLYPSCEERRAIGKRRLEQVLLYGTHGGPTHFALENAIAEIEGGTRCQLYATGLAAIAVPLLAFLSAGDHLLMPDSVYGPARNLCDTVLKRHGVETTYYDPRLDEAGIAPLFQPNTKVLYVESPGSHTFEMQDVPALARAAHARGAKVLMDNTWGFHHFQPFAHGVDVSIQALTKYAVGHSDVLLGSATVANDADWETLRTASTTLGQYASPDDCWLALRGLRTLKVRMREQEAAGLAVARWFSQQPQVKQVLHPALPGAPGHEIWKRDFTGAASLFGVVFQPRYTEADIFRMVDGLSLFGIGASWGGYESLALPTTNFITRTATSADLGGPAVRFHIGLEEVDDILADLAAGLARLDGR
jgi:cystathionine beta-lyase